MQCSSYFFLFPHPCLHFLISFIFHTKFDSSPARRILSSVPKYKSTVCAVDSPSSLLLPRGGGLLYSLISFLEVHETAPHFSPQLLRIRPCHFSSLSPWRIPEFPLRNALFSPCCSKIHRILSSPRRSSVLNLPPLEVFFL